MPDPLISLDALLTPTAVGIGIALLSFAFYLSSTLLASAPPKQPLPLNTTEHEWSSPVELVTEGGTLNPAAVGWSRQPAHTTELLPQGLRWGYRTKQWEYWGIVSPKVVVGLTLADLDFGTVIQIYIYDRETDKTYTWEEAGIPPNRDNVRLPKTLPPFTAQGKVGGLEVQFSDNWETPEPTGGKTTTLKARAPASGSQPAVEVNLEVDARGESFGVVVPWSESRFQYTVKAPALPVSGSVKLGDRSIQVSKGWAVVDRGRGRWPYTMKWNWGVAIGENEKGQRVGLTMGARWTDGTGTTENALVLDGRVLGQGPLPDVKWTYDMKNPERPWRIKGEWIDAEITPWHVRVAGAQKVVMSSFTTQVFGQWRGKATVDGKEVSLDGLTGWAEDAANRW